MELLESGGPTNAVNQLLEDDPKTLVWHVVSIFLWGKRVELTTLTTAKEGTAIYFNLPTSIPGLAEKSYIRNTSIIRLLTRPEGLWFLQLLFDRYKWTVFLKQEYIHNDWVVYASRAIDAGTPSQYLYAHLVTLAFSGILRTRDSQKATLGVILCFDISKPNVEGTCSSILSTSQFSHL